MVVICSQYSGVPQMVSLQYLKLTNEKESARIGWGWIARGGGGVESQIVQVMHISFLKYACTKEK